MVRVSWVDAGVTELGVGVELLVDFVAAPTGVVNVRFFEWCLSGDNKPDSTAVTRVRRDAKAAVRVRRD